MEPGQVTTPHDWFGFAMGCDRRLARWPSMLAYFQYLASCSDRLLYAELGIATLGQPMVLLTISSPDNLRRLERLQAVQQRLADARMTTAEERDRLIEEARVICMVTCAIHATEVGSAQMTPELVHALVTRSDPDTIRLLSETVLLLVPSMNPDGLEVVADWYEATVGTAAEGTPPPTLYHPYAGHDNNRDWVVQSQVETQLIVRHVHRPWRPHIILDLHQMQSNGPRYVVPPYIDPYDLNIDPILRAEINALGTCVVADLTAAGKTGVASSIIFDAYAPSRAYAPYHGGVRILAEAASARIASRVTICPDQLEVVRGFDPRVALQNHPMPWPGGEWTPRDIVDYHLITVRAVLDHAARWRDRWVRRCSLAQERGLVSVAPTAFVIAALAEQPDPATTVELLSVLTGGDVEIWRTAAPFDANGQPVAAGSFVIPTAQPYGRYAKTLMEIQRYPETASRVPYDVVGHTLWLQFGVRATEVTAAITVPMDRLRDPLVVGMVGSEDEWAENAVAVSCDQNASYRLVNSIQGPSGLVKRVLHAASDRASNVAPGTFIIAAGATQELTQVAGRLGVRLRPAREPGTATYLRPPRVGIYRSWKPNAIDEGWTRFVLEDYRFSCSTLRDNTIRADRLRGRYDAVVIPHQTRNDMLEGNGPLEYPAGFAGGLGDEGMASLRRFADDGGTVIAVDGACETMIREFTLPIRNVLDGVPPETFSCPGSILRMIVDHDHPSGWGYQREAAVMFFNSPAFEVRRGATARTVAWYPPENQLLSGMLRGGALIARRSAIVEIPRGKGRVVLLGFRPLFRAQMRGTYRFLFNALWLSTHQAGIGSDLGNEIGMSTP